MKGETKKETALCRPVSTRHVIFLFVVLVVFVAFNLVTSGTQLSVVFDVTMKMRSDVFSALSDLIRSKKSLHVNNSMLVKSFSSKETALADYRKWLETHSYGMHHAFKTTVNISTVPTAKDAMEKEEKLPTLQENDGTQIVYIDGTNKAKPDENRKDTCSQCFKHNFRYVVDNPDICQTTNGQVIKIIMFILTIHKNTAQRNAIRETWLTYAKNNTGEVRYAFVLGETKDEALQNAVLAENDIFHDILKEDFVDTYANLTFKTIMAFKWAATKCAQAKFVMKTDDDMFVNVANLLNLVDDSADVLRGGIVGSCAKMAKPIRDKGSKWYASVKSYPNPTYPGFCSGTGYVTSTDVARKVYEISPAVPFFHLEDVYVALCIAKLGLRLTSKPGFNPGRPRLDPCLYKSNKLFTAHQLSPVDLRYIWKAECRKNRQ